MARPIKEGLDKNQIKGIRIALRVGRKMAIKKYIERIRIELDQRIDLRESLDDKINVFIDWASKQRLDYEPDIEEEVSDFLKEEYGNNHVRLYSINVKEWYRRRDVVFEKDNYTCQYCGQRVEN